MINKLFRKLAERLSFTSAVAVFSTSWSWLASFFGFYFVFSAVHFFGRELSLLIATQVAATACAVLFHLVQFGILHRFGLSGLFASLRIVNRGFDRVSQTGFRPGDFGDSTVEKLYDAIISLPRTNLVTAIFYTFIVILTLIVTVFLHGADAEKIALIGIGGSFASLIIGYFTYNISEFLTGPYKEKIEAELYRRNKTYRYRHTLSIRSKSLFTLVLVFFSMIILVVLIRSSERSFALVASFIALSISAIGFLIYLSLNTVNIALTKINRATEELAAGGQGLYFPSFPDRELVLFSNNYNRAATEINEIRTHLENKVQQRTVQLKAAYDSLAKIYRQIQADLTLARRIQERIMPGNIDTGGPLDLSVDYHPMSDIGGDLYDVTELYPGFVRIFLADAMGHGVQAALVTMIIKSEYEKVKKFDSVQLLLEVLNSSFIELYGAMNVFFSCVVADLDVNRKKLTFASAGHPEQIFIRNGDIVGLPHTGRLMGIRGDAKYDLINKDLGKGDKILLFTDGLYEQSAETKESFGEDSLRKIIEKHRGGDIDALRDRILSGLAEYLGNDKISTRDDTTLICLQVRND